jgi:hypothetical protein
MAVAINLVRLGAWFSRTPSGTTRQSAFVKVMEPVLA